MGTIRIIAGRLKGRRLSVPDDPALRPTADRVREALFDILGPGPAPPVVLDLYAGTGAFGFEALSRGSRRAVFVESHPRLAMSLRRVAAELGVEQEARVIAGRVLDVLDAGTLDGPFDLVVADPPYDDPSASGLSAAIVRSGVLDRGGLLVIERDRRSPPHPDSGALRNTRTARYGRTSLDFFKFSLPDGTSERGC